MPSILGSEDATKKKKEGERRSGSASRGGASRGSLYVLIKN